MDFNTQCTGGWIRAQLGFGGVEFSHVGAGFVLMVFTEEFADGVGHGGFGAEDSGFFHVVFDGAGIEAFSEGEVAESDLAVGEIDYPLAEFPVELAPGGRANCYGAST